MKKRRKLNRLAKQRALFVESFSGEEWEGDIAEGDGGSDQTDDDDAQSVASSPPRRRSKRSSTIKGRRGRSDLPFSPRKTRSHRRVFSDSEISETSVYGVDHTRKSNRIRNSRGANTMDRDYDDGESDSLSDEYVSPVRNPRPKGKIKVPKRGKASRAAYGHIRSIADLEYDELENGPLSAHRHTCERCQRKPTHILLEQQRKSNKTKRKPKNEFEEDSDGEDKLASLGGWVRWQARVPKP